MKNTFVLYKSNYGYTKTYASMIAETLGCDIQEASHISADLLQRYDTIIYGGGLYAGGINGIHIIKQNFQHLQKKHIVVWATGLNPGQPSEMEQVWKRNLPDPMLKQIRTFYLRGGFDYQKLSFIHKLMMNALKWKIKASKAPSQEEENLLKAFDTPESYCDKKNIVQLVEYVRAL